jgi:hypothetical protein
VGSCARQTSEELEGAGVDESADLRGCERVIQFSLAGTSSSRIRALVILPAISDQYHCQPAEARMSLSILWLRRACGADGFRCAYPEEVRPANKTGDPDSRSAVTVSPIGVAKSTVSGA